MISNTLLQQFLSKKQTKLNSCFVKFYEQRYANFVRFFLRALKLPTYNNFSLLNNILGSWKIKRFYSQNWVMKFLQYASIKNLWPVKEFFLYWYRDWNNTKWKMHKDWKNELQKGDGTKIWEIYLRNTTRWAEGVNLFCKWFTLYRCEVRISNKEFF